MNQKKLFKEKEFEFINKSIYFPKLKVLAIGDLHLGHEFTFRESGSLFPETQMRLTKNEIDKIFHKLKIEKKQVKKVIFLGDLKHFFSYQKGEKTRFLEIMYIVSKHIPRQNIITIKGNHEKIAKIADKKLIEYYIIENIAFIHGDILPKEILKKEISTVVMGHLHPAIILRDPEKVKQEKYKCYLIGKYKNKKFIILPSFLPTIEGAIVNAYLTDTHSIIPAKNLEKFNVFAIGKNKVYEFGKLKKLKLK
jgi:uncharacterized protein